MDQAAPATADDLALGQGRHRAREEGGASGRRLWTFPSLPPAPESLSSLGLPERFLEDLMLKTLYRIALPTIAGLSASLRLPPALVREILEGLKRARYVETSSSSGRLENEWQFRLTDGGMREAEAAFSRSRYAGPVPVPIQEYFAVLQYDEEVGLVDPAPLARSLQQLVLGRDTVAKICLALTSGRPSVLWGAPGNGKTTILELCGEALRGVTLMPVAVFVSGHVIRLYDEQTHTLVESGDTMDLVAAGDRRWLRVRRPFVFVGGELRSEDLDLAYDAATGAHQAPPHMKAHGGLLAIDDFGRQQVAPTTLLNRWIAALERGEDTVSLVTGERVSFPFRCAICFSTNIDPRLMLEEAHLRRLPYKVHVPEPSPAQVAEIFRRFAHAMGVHTTADDIGAAVRLVGRASDAQFRSCHPRDVLQLVVEEAHFVGSSPRLEAEAVRRACEVYFGDDPGPDDWVDDDVQDGTQAAARSQGAG